MPRRDAVLKGALEQISGCLHALELGGAGLVSELYAVALSTPPPPAAILVLEALMILLSPSEAHKGPRTSGGVGPSSWEAARCFLLLPLVEVLALLRAINIATIPAGNLEALREYATHTDWPVAGTRIAGTAALALLVDFVRAVITYGDALAAEGGPPTALASGHGSLFSAVIVLRDECLGSDTGDLTPQQAMVAPAFLRARVRLVSLPGDMGLSVPVLTAGKAAGPEEEASQAASTLAAESPSLRGSAVRRNTGGGGGDTAWRDGVVSVLSSTLAGLAAFTTVVTMDGRETTVNMYRDCGRVYVEAIASAVVTSPKIARFIWTRDDLEHVNELLAPSPLQRTSAPPRPMTSKDVYMRLTQLLHFYSATPAGGRVELCFRRGRVRLLRSARKVCHAKHTACVRCACVIRLCCFVVVLRWNPSMLLFPFGRKVLASTCWTRTLAENVSRKRSLYQNASPRASDE